MLSLPLELSQQVKVLVVDDDRAWTEFLTALLRTDPVRFDLTVSTSVDEARELFARGKWDVALIDNRLIGGSGLDLLRSDVVRRAGVPLIMVTADEQAVEAALAAGADDYLVKSDLSAAMLQRTIRYAVERQRVKTEQARTRVELDHIFELSPDMLCTANFDGYLTRTNAAWQSALGFSAAELQSRPFLEFVHPDDRVSTIAELQHLCNGGRTFNFTNRYRAKNGGERWLEWHARSDAGTGVIYAVARDQTERRRLEQQLRQAQKMEAVGQLAGGVAHDFNNILTAINGFSELALEAIPADTAPATYVHETLKACGRASALTRQLLAFSRRQILAPEVLDLGAVVSRMSAMLVRIIGEDIELRINAAPDLDLVSADRGQIEQIILNLAVNARDAMPTGGRLAIAVTNVNLDEAFRQRHPEASLGPHVLITVTDTGHGMTEEVRSRLFEPFFTTKEVGKGTGLGLATVYGIVKQSGGFIAVSSAPGAGATFRIYLPRTDATPHADVRSTAPERVAGSETVLVVEDQLEVRQVVHMTLVRHGYTVLDASGAFEAEAKLASHRRPVDLVLTDVVMPHLGGGPLVERLKRHQPDLRVLYMSGYTDDAMMRHGVPTPETAFLAKPFTTTALLRAVRNALDEK